MEFKKSKYLRISSSDKNPSQSEHNGLFTVNLKDKDVFQHVKAFSVVSTTIPNVLYNIRSSQGNVNNTLLITQVSQPQATIVIPEGQYLLSELTTVLKTQIDLALSGANTVTITSDITKKLTFTYTVNVIMHAESKIAPAIGLTITTPSQLISIMNYIPNLASEQELYLHSQQIGLNAMADGSAGGISAFTWVSMAEVPFGSFGTRESQTFDNNITRYTKDVNYTTIQVRLRDINGNTISPGTMDVSFILKIFY